LGRFGAKLLGGNRAYTGAAAAMLRLEAHLSSFIISLIVPTYCCATWTLSKTHPCTLINGLLEGVDHCTFTSNCASMMRHHLSSRLEHRPSQCITLEPVKLLQAIEENGGVRLRQSLSGDCVLS
jgi:hypothetical protein